MSIFELCYNGDVACLICNCWVDVQVIKDASLVPADMAPFVVTIGNFDGLHKGHKYLLSETVNIAKKLNMRSLVITLYPHPVIMVRGVHGMLINDESMKCSMMQSAGIDVLLVLPFDCMIKNMSAADFVEHILVAVGVGHVVVGRGFCFGKGRSGNCDFLRAMGIKHGFGLSVLELLSNGELVYSSSAVREAILQRDMVSCRDMLGRGYTLVLDVDGSTLSMNDELYSVRASADGAMVRPGVAVYRVESEGGIELLCAVLSDGCFVLYSRLKDVLATKKMCVSFVGIAAKESLCEVYA